MSAAATNEREPLEGRWSWLATALPVLAALALHAQGLRGGFIWDDRTFFIDNDVLPALRPWDLTAIATQPLTWWGEKRPLSEWLFVTQSWLFGRQAFGYHVVSLALYALLGVAVARLLRAFHDLCDGPRPWPVSVSCGIVLALFLFHPVHVECVDYIVGQEHLVASILGLTAVLLLLRGWRERRLGSWATWIPLLASYYAACLAKYQALAIGLFVPCLWLIWLRTREIGVIRAAAAWTAVHVPVLAWLLWSTRHYGYVHAASGGVDEIVVRALRLVGAHAWLVIKPHPLSFGYPWIEQGNPVDGFFFLGAAIVLALGILLWLRPRSAPTLGLLIFLVFLFPVLQLLVAVDNAGVYDRYLVVAVLGPCLMAERLLARLAASGRIGGLAARAIGMATLVALAALTSAYIPALRSDLASARHAWEHFPEWRRVPFDLADSLVEAGELEEARRLVETERSLAEPRWVRPFFLGRIALAEGDAAAALPLLANAGLGTRLNRHFPFADVPLAEAWVRLGEPERARGPLATVLTSPMGHPVWQHRAAQLWRRLFPGEAVPRPPSRR